MRPQHLLRLPRQLRRLRPIWAAPLLATALAVAAQPAKPVWRCANGSYSDQPCPGGQAVQVDDSRSPAQQAQARDAAQREAALAERLQKERLKQEAAAQRQPAPLSGIGQAPVAEKPKPKAHAASAAKPPHRAQRAQSAASSAAGHAAGTKKAVASPRTPGTMGQY